MGLLFQAKATALILDASETTNAGMDATAKFASSFEVLSSIDSTFWIIFQHWMCVRDIKTSCSRRTCFTAGGIYIATFAISLWQARLNAFQSSKKAEFDWCCIFILSSRQQFSCLKIFAFGCSRNNHFECNNFSVLPWGIVGLLFWCDQCVQDVI